MDELEKRLISLAEVRGDERPKIYKLVSDFLNSKIDYDALYQGLRDYCNEDRECKGRIPTGNPTHCANYCSVWKLKNICVERKPELKKLYKERREMVSRKLEVTTAQEKANFQSY